MPRDVLDHHVGHLVRREPVLAEEEQRRQVATGAVQNLEGLGRQRVPQGQQPTDGGLRGLLVPLEAAEEGDLGVDAWSKAREGVEDACNCVMVTACC